MKILFAGNISRQNPGGVLRVNLSLGAGLQKRGHAVDYIFREELGVKESRLSFLVFGIKLFIHLQNARTPSYDYLLTGSSDGVWIALFSGIIKKLPKNIMICHGWEERVDLVWREEAAFHSVSHTWFNKASSRLLRFPLLRLNLKYALRIVAVSSADLKFLKERYPRETNKVYCIPNGVDQGFFIARREHYDGRSVLFVGNWTWKKGVKYLLEAIRELFRINRKAQITLAGTGIPSESILRLLPNEFGNRCTILGTLNTSGMKDLYLKNDILLSTSIFEGSPLVFREAMACGMACVVFQWAGIEDLIKDGENGILIDKRDVKRLARVLDELFMRPDRVMQLGHQAQASVRHLTWDKSAELLENILPQ